MIVKPSLSLQVSLSRACIKGKVLVIKWPLPPISSWSTVWIASVQIIFSPIFLHSHYRMRLCVPGVWRINFLSTIVDWWAEIAWLYSFIMVNGTPVLAAFTTADLSYVIWRSMLAIPNLISWTLLPKWSYISSVWRVPPRYRGWRLKNGAKEAGG